MQPVAHHLLLFVFVGSCVAGCSDQTAEFAPSDPLPARVITERVTHDSDDPAIWIHPEDPAKSLIIGTDKDSDGGLYVFNLDGQIIQEKTVKGLARPNNVDVAYGLMLDGTPTDIAVATERYAHKIRIFSLPDMTPLDNGGIDVFVGEEQREPMGIALYSRPDDNAIFAIVGRKEGPTDGSYLWQYRLEDDGSGQVRATKVREFGVWSGIKEIEAIAVDNELGYVYYSDELVGIRKYHADPDHQDGNVELALFGTEGFARDREGISIYKINDGTGYIIVSDQDANHFRMYSREGAPENPHEHTFIKTVHLSTTSSDGSDVTNVPLGDAFPKGLFVAMSEGGTFHLYGWEDLAGDDLIVAPAGNLSEEMAAR